MLPADLASEVRRPRGRAELDAAMALRRAVFCGEQGVPVGLDVDGRDGEALHLVAVRGANVIGTCRLLVDGDTAKLGRLVVTRAQRGRGVGRALVAAAEAEARAAGAKRVALHAQSHATGLYAAQGFVTRGARFREAGIEHVRMEKGLA